MPAALLVAFLGFLLCFVVGTRGAGLSEAEVWNILWACQVAAFCSLIATTRAERVLWIKKNILNRGYKTWSFHSFVYLGVLFGLAPPLRQTRAFALMFIPLLMTCGIAILAFGPIQDFLVKIEQKKAKP